MAGSVDEVANDPAGTGAAQRAALESGEPSSLHVDLDVLDPSSSVPKDFPMSTTSLEGLTVTVELCDVLVWPPSGGRRLRRLEHRDLRP